MKNRTADKINEILSFIAHLKEFTPQSLDEYKKNILKKSACERTIEKIIEASVDLTFIVLRELNKEIPPETSDTEVFDIISNLNIISKNLSTKLKEAKGMRNLLVHEYGKIDDSIVYNSIEELEKDIGEFVNAISKSLEVVE